MGKIYTFTEQEKDEFVSKLATRLSITVAIFGAFCFWVGRLTA